MNSLLSCFNPLHCGAVVASGDDLDAWEPPADVSIPFIAGQWSLHDAFQRVVALLRIVSIPFIAGQWSLHAGDPSMDGIAVQFQSPSLRGSGRFLLPAAPVPPPLRVSIPFLAGLWSLLTW